MSGRTAGSLALETASDCLLRGRGGTPGRPEALAGARRLRPFLGRLSEVSGGLATSVLTFAMRLVVEAQRAGEPVAWITGGDVFYPPDAHAAGVDLDALVIVRLPRNRQSRAAREGMQPARAADHLLRSGAFGLVVLDLGSTPGGEADGHRMLPLPIQSRLAGLAKKHGSALVVLTEHARESGDGREAPRSLGPLVSLHVDVSRRAGAGGAGSSIAWDEAGGTLRVLKSKLPGGDAALEGLIGNELECCRAPDGLC